MNYIIAVDFDGTLCEDKFPNIGQPNKTHKIIIRYLQAAHDLGATICLWTCRRDNVIIDNTNTSRDYLTEAVKYCDEQNIPIDFINDGPNVFKNSDSDSRKIFANEYIDDRNIGGLNIFLSESFIRGRLTYIKSYINNML